MHESRKSTRFVSPWTDQIRTVRSRVNESSRHPRRCVHRLSLFRGYLRLNRPPYSPHAMRATTTMATMVAIWAQLAGPAIVL
jgi:hypothetical protein